MVFNREGKNQMKKLLIVLTLPVFICVFSLSCQNRQTSDHYEEVLKNFQNPPVDFRSAPLWVWNDRVTREQIDSQLADFREHGIGGVFIHPRPGLITPYLSEEWMTLCRYAVEVGKQLGMKIWLYDENSYPSGFAGGHVPAALPDASGRGLMVTRVRSLPEKFESPPLLVLKETASGFEDITQAVYNQSFSEGEYFIFDLKEANPSPWFGGYTYVDLMRRDVTDKFLDVTLNAYKKVIGDEFGATVPGVFQDEAHILPVGGRDVVNFTPALFDEFRTRWGYDLKRHLPSLFWEKGDWKRVRHNYYATLLDLFIENWAQPYYDYCAQNDLVFTGHYWEHEWPRPRLSPDNMALCAYAHMPGIDCLMNEWETHAHAQFGNTRAVKEIRSAANQLGKRRTLSETYGASGWDLTFFDQKRIGDWEYVLGVNFLNQHLSYVTIKGARKRDHPLSFSYHEPWWHAYKILADYFGRLSWVMSSGLQENRILVLEPTSTAWMYYSPDKSSDRLEAQGSDFQDFLHRLEAGQVEYDLASEAILKDYGKVRGNKLIVGECKYDLAVLPPGIENLNKATVSLIESYLARGGQVLSLVDPPKFVDGQQTDQVEKLASQYESSWYSGSVSALLEKVNKICPPDLVFIQPEKLSGLLFHHRRKLKDAEFVFFVNSSDLETSNGKFTTVSRQVESWDLFTGSVSAYPAEDKDGKIGVSFSLPPGGSLLLCLRQGRPDKKEEPRYSRTELTPEPGEKISALAPNVLILDYCDLSLNGSVEKDLYFYEAQQKIFTHHGLPRNPWDSAVQFKTNIIDQEKFPDDSGFEASFWFTCDPGLDLSSLRLVAEQSDLFRVLVNSKPVERLEGEWWLDRAFGTFNIGEVVTSGKNRITLKVSPFSIFAELEPVYLLGDFKLESENKGFKLVPARQLEIGPWDKQGMPFYSNGISYQKTYTIQALNPQKERFLVKLGDWKGSMAEVRVRKNAAGLIAFPPCELDITEFLAPGKNLIEVIVYGTLKNTLGPHHNNPPLGRAWPSIFRQGAEGGYPPGSEYGVVSYGLLEDFKMISRKRD